MYRVSYVILLLGILSWLWALISVRTITVERRNRTQRAQVGGYFEEWVAVDNTWFLPKPWVEIRSDSNLSEHDVRRGFFLGPKARRSWTLRTQCTSRGKFTLGDIIVSTGDPFGLFQRRVRFPPEPRSSSIRERSTSSPPATSQANCPAAPSRRATCPS